MLTFGAETSTLGQKLRHLGALLSVGALLHIWGFVKCWGFVTHLGLKHVYPYSLQIYFSETILNIATA